MLNKVLGVFSHLHKDSRSSSPARSPKKAPQAAADSAAAPAVLQGTDTSSSHAAAAATAAATATTAAAANGEQQGAAHASNGAASPPPAAAPADAGAVVASPDPAPQQQQQQQEPGTKQLAAAGNGVAAAEEQPNGAAAAAASSSRPILPPVPPLAPGTVTRTSSAGSGSTSRRASLLSDAGRASSRTSLSQQQQLEVSFQLDHHDNQQQDTTQQQQQKQPVRFGPVTQLPLHLVPGAVAGGSSTPVPPSVAPQQQQQQAGSSSTDPSQPQQPPPFWHGSNWSFGLHCEQNRRMHMEDRFAATDLTGSEAFSSAQRAGFFAVFDGHSGAEAAEYLEAHLQSYVLAAGPQALAERPLQVLKEAVQQAEREIVGTFVASGSETAGSTLCALLLVDDKLHVAHVGDSRAVLGRGAESIQLTRDHKPGCSIEAARINDDDPNADISRDGYMYGELAVARAIGSAAWKKDPSRRALIPTPDLVSIQLQPEDDFVLLATDGLWDKVDNTQAIAAARRSLARTRDAQTAAKDLVERAQRLDSTDNISVVALLLHGRAISVPKSNSMLFKRSSALASAIAAAGQATTSGGGGADSPPLGCSTPCSGASTPASGATPRSCTPSRGHSLLISTASAPAAAMAAAAAAAGGGAGPPAAAAATMSPQRSLPPPQPSPRQD